MPDLIEMAVTGLPASAAGELEALRGIDADSLPDDGETPSHPVVWPGDVWRLGPHTVVCGDSTDPGVVKAALGPVVPVLMVTDPPYGVEYDANWRNNKAWRSDGTPSGGRAIGAVMNDSRADWRDAWKLFPGDVAYVWHGYLRAKIVQDSLESVGFTMRMAIVWVKSRFVIGRGDYHCRHETCWYAVRKGKTSHWSGSRSETSTWHIKHIKSDTGHSTQKPVECMKRPIENNSASGEAIYDPFLGSGTTLIAAEMTGRVCCGVELNPLYVYIMIRRWQMFTGRMAMLGDETFAEVLMRRRDQAPSTTVISTPEIAVRSNGAAVVLAPKTVVLAPRCAEPAVVPAAASTTLETAQKAVAVTVSPRGSKRAEPPAKAPATQSELYNVAPLADPFAAAHAERLAAAGIERLSFDEAEWDHGARSAVGVDVETYRNFFLVCFKRFSDGRRVAFEYSGRSDLDAEGITAILRQSVMISFNGFAYDLPLIAMALEGASNQRLFEMSSNIVLRDLRPWQVGVKTPRWNHVDLMEVNPSVRQGLKTLYGRLHGRYLVDLPYLPDTKLTPEQMNMVTLYCMNDLDATETLYRAVVPQLQLRVALGERYKLDLRSKSDAQVGELIVRSRVERDIGHRVAPPPAGTAQFKYNPPAFIKFNSQLLSDVETVIRETEFSVDGAGGVSLPKSLEGLKVTIGQTTYALGIGGLHSTEEHRAVRADHENFLLDVDVASQYPNIVMGLGLYPSACGQTFLRIYRELIDDRLAAKAAGDRARADGGKIAVNGIFGKLGSPHSVLYAPHLLVATTLTGQLSILMLVERAEAIGVSAISANTDGVIFRCPRQLEGALTEILTEWEEDTGFTLESTRYMALYSASVNTYVAVSESGKVKRKGWIANPWGDGDMRGQMMKNPQMTVCSDAVVAYLTDGRPLDDFIWGCADPRAFVTLIKVTGGAIWNGTPLGRVVRYYWSSAGGPITYVNGGRRVAKTEGSRPMLELTDELPDDLDRIRYCDEASRLLRELGA